MDDEDERRTRRMSLIGLAAVVVVFAIGWWVARDLYESGRTEDCLMSGRSNCETLQAPVK